MNSPKPPLPRRGRKRRTFAGPADDTDTSSSTSRKAYVETRRWLLHEYGPVCAYCGLTNTPRSMTLDHVTPRRSQSAYDRRDNLVLCCKRCNSAKGDKPFIAYLLGQPQRAVNLYRYGRHLSAAILDHVRHMAGEPVTDGPPPKPRMVYGPDDDQDESPYVEDGRPPRPTIRPASRPPRRRRSR